MFACVLIVQIIPTEDVVAFADRGVDVQVIILKVIYLLLAIMLDTLFTTVIGEDIGLNYVIYEAEVWIPAVLLGVLLWWGIFYYGHKTKMLLWFLMPYVMFAFSGIVIYMFVHHIGIIELVLVFWLWICKVQYREDEHTDCIIQRQGNAAGKVIFYMVAVSILCHCFGIFQHVCCI